MHEFSTTSWRGAFALVILGMLLACPLRGAGESLDLGLSRWLRNRDAIAAGATGGKPELQLEWPGENRFSVPVAASWRGWGELVIEIEVPEDLPPDLDVWVYTKDWDLLWRQVRLRRPDRVGGLMRLRVPIAGDAADAAWAPVGHRRRWHTLTPEQIRVLGLKFECGAATTFTGAARIRSVLLQTRVGEASPTIRNFGFGPGQARVGELCQATFEMAGFTGNPFDRGNLAVDAVISGPDGRSERVSGFYSEGFVLQPVSLKGELLPAGRPAFQVRYLPRAAGAHRMSITVVNGGRKLSLPTVDFMVSPPAKGYRGFVRVDRSDANYLCYDDGSWLRGIGVNVRSPTDTRHAAMVPHNLWEDEGINFYERIFPIYRDAGINVAEVWLSSWWLALEWIPDAPGNHGVGYFNQHRAWLLDRLVAAAERNGIQLILVINNHGKFSTFCDEEWASNPFNRENGGFLAHNELFFSDQRAREAFRNLADYLVARWAHSPSILCWKLFSEINLTGMSTSFYHSAAMVAWHREMSDYFHAIDPYGHLVTTHWSSNYTVINRPIAILPGLDILTTDAYASNYGRSDQVMDFLRGTTAYAAAMKKPVVVTEFGGHPMGDSLEVLRRQLHLGNWFGFFGKSAILPMLWWFAIVDEEDFYGEYRAISAFMAGEDPRGMRNFSQPLPDHGMQLEMLKGNGRMLLWGYDIGYFQSVDESERPREVSGMTLSVEGLRRGDYILEHWDCASGKVKLQQSLEIGADGKCRIQIPAFRGDFAAKIVPAK